MSFTGFGRDFFEFFEELAANNERPWFEANKDRYRETVVAACISFIEEMAPRLAGISRHYVADPKPNGGSMFRIYRDVRFLQGQAAVQGARGRAVPSFGRQGCARPRVLPSPRAREGDLRRWNLEAARTGARQDTGRDRQRPSRLDPGHQQQGAQRENRRHYGGCPETAAEGLFGRARSISKTSSGKPSSPCVTTPNARPAPNPSFRTSRMVSGR